MFDMYGAYNDGVTRRRYGGIYNKQLAHGGGSYYDLASCRALYARTHRGWVTRTTLPGISYHLANAGARHARCRASP